MILESVKNAFIIGKNQDFRETLSDNQKYEIVKGLADIANDATVSYDSVIHKHRK